MNEVVYLFIIGFLLGLSTYLAFKPRLKSKADGQIVVKTDPETGNKVFSLELDKSPEEIESMGNVSFKVNHQNGDSQ